MKLLWGSFSNYLSLLGWLVYFGGSIGYLVSDGLSLYGGVPDVVYVFLALVFVFDALLYLGAWWRERTSSWVDLWGWSEIVNVGASLVTLASALLLLWPPPVQDGPLALQTHLLFSSCLVFSGCLLFLLNALMCNSLFHMSRRRSSSSFWKDAYTWAELLNTLAGAGYFASSCMQLASHLAIARLHDSPPALLAAFFEVRSLIRAVNIAFDLLYCVDALLYGLVWISEEAKEKIHDGGPF